jgi:hypothetical protein
VPLPTTLPCTPIIIIIIIIIIIMLVISEELEERQKYEISGTHKV